MNLLADSENNRKISFSFPEVPSVIRYYDEFNDKTRSITNPQEDDLWCLRVAGSNCYLDFNRLSPELRKPIKCWSAFLIQTLAPGTAANYFGKLLNLTSQEIVEVFNSLPTDIRSIWNTLLTKGYTNSPLVSLKSILNFLCRFNLGGWSPEYLEFLSSLPLPTVDKFANVRTGEVFLSIEEEAILVSYFDDTTQRIIKSPYFF